MNPRSALTKALFAGAIAALAWTNASARIALEDKAFLGIAPAPEIPEAVASHLGIDGGVMVARVAPDSPASRAGLRRHDVIVGANDSRVRELEDLTRVLGSLDSGADLHLKIRRGAETLDLVARLGPSPSPDAAKKEPGFLGVRFSPVPPVLAAHLDLDERTGVVVDAVLPDSPAAAAGLDRFDLILRVGGETVRFDAPPENAGAAIQRAPMLLWRLEEPSDVAEAEIEELQIDDEDLRRALEAGGGPFAPGTPAPPVDTTNFRELVGKHSAGESVELDIVHRGERKTVAVTLGKRPAEIRSELFRPLPPGEPRIRVQPFGRPHVLSKGKIVIQGPDGQTREIEIPRLHIEKGLRLDEEMLRKLQGDTDQSLPPELLDSLRKAFENLELDLDLEIEEAELREAPDRKAVRIRTIQHDDGTHRIHIHEENGERTVSVYEGDRTLAERLPWSKLSDLPEDLRRKVEATAKQLPEAPEAPEAPRRVEKSRKAETPIEEIRLKRGSVRRLPPGELHRTTEI